MDRPFKVTQATLDVMEALLVSGEDVHGYAIAQAARKPTGSVYPILARLESAGWLESNWETGEQTPGVPRKRFYRLTPNGTAGVREVLLERRGALPSRPAQANPLHRPGWGIA
ncbi:PadR family transcriptional regulator [Streptomyces sp. NPDC127168]|uniref:PadR family transcriptional regulator n=1 Tax=Streptomyces TaxID=1883 RepID=UPI001CFA9B76|nr:helix-turn-helix transcriptional regulator [Streptomyces parvulus]